MSLHYMSGTGNTYRVARWIAQRAKERGARVDIESITAQAASNAASIHGSERRLVGVLSPTHGFTAPWAAIAGAARIPGVRGSEAFVVVTRAGWFVGPVRLPGLEGTAGWLLALILALRGGRVVGVRAIDMPSNWTALHWGMNARHVDAILRPAGARARVFADRLVDERPCLRGYVSLIAGLILVPVSLGYLLVARPLLAKLFFADENCSSCGLCARRCPFGAVLMTGTPPHKPYWTSDCESCMRCMNICPERAIQANWLAAVLETYLALVALEVAAGVAALLGGSLAATTGATLGALAATVGVVILGYRLSWPVSRTHRVAWLLGHTTPTRFYRRYREPESDLRGL